MVAVRLKTDQTHSCRLTVKQYDRENSDQVHYSSGGSAGAPITVCGVKTSMPCFHNCQIFLLCGAFCIEGQGRLVDPGCSYLVEGEEWIGLCGNKTVVVVLEEGEQRGACRRATQEAQDKLLAEGEKGGSKDRCSVM
jgi:hypothetical protein